MKCGPGTYLSPDEDAIEAMFCRREAALLQREPE